MAALAAYAEFRQRLRNPNTSIVADACAERQAVYNTRWMAYDNSIFDELRYGSYAAANNLYPKTRGLYNCNRRAVDFYVAALYTGILTLDGDNLPDGEMLAIPFSKDTPDEVKEAIAQCWQWGNWNQNLYLWCLYCASMGDGPLEAVENTETGRVWPQVIPPGFITDIEFDERENVVYYVKEYSAYDRDANRQYSYKKVVDRETIREYRDGALIENGERDNPYGFAPLVWNSHVRIGSLPGGPAMRSWSKIEELNSLATRIGVFLRVQSQSPNVIFGSGDVEAVTFDATKDSEQAIKLFSFKGENGTIGQLTGALDLPASLDFMKQLITEIEHDHPEITMYNEMRSMGDVSGKAVELLLGDVKGHVFRARANYDAAQERLFKMLLTMGGVRVRAKQDGWSTPTEQQKKFAPFDLESFESGEMDFSIAPRPLLPKTNQQIAEEDALRYQSYKAGEDAGLPLEYQLEQKGYDAAELAKLRKSQDAKMSRFVDSELFGIDSVKDDEETNRTSQAETEARPVPA